MINPLQSAALNPAMESPLPGSVEKPAGKGFGSLLEDLLGKVNLQQTAADRAVNDFAMGKTENLHGIMLEVAKADLSFRLFLEIRNRLTDAFQEIMRMQV
jgi:flagellar hook-basal body complex protein FliE